MISQATKNLLTLIFLALIWGSSYILMERGLVSFSAIQVAALRIIFSALVLLPFVRKVKKEDIPYILIIAFLGSGLPTFIYPYAIQHIEGSVAGIINSLTPVFTVLFGVLLFKTKIKLFQGFGLLLSFSGALLLILYGSSGESLSFNKFALIAVLAPMFYGLSTNVLKSKLSHINSVSLTASTFFILLPFALAVLFNSNFLEVMHTKPEAYLSLGFVSILGIVGTAFALVIFNFLIKKTSAIYASSVTFLMPIVVLFWGFFDKENIGFFHISGLVLILLGVYILNYVKKDIKPKK